MMGFIPIVSLFVLTGLTRSESIDVATSGQNPFESPRPRGVPLMQGTLRVVVAAYCFSIAAARLHLGEMDPLILFLFPDEDVAGARMASMSNLIAYGAAAIGLITLLRPIHVLLLGVIVHAAGVSVAGMYPETIAWAAWSPARQATCWGAPLALLLLDFWPPRIKSTLAICLAAVSLLRLTTVATLLTLGLICLDQCQHGGGFADLMKSAALNGFQRDLTADQSQQFLGYAAGIHLGLAAALLTSRQGSVPLLAAAWGVLWTLLPLFSAAATGYQEALRFISLWGAPLVVAMFQILSIKKRRPKYIAENESPGSTKR